MRRLVILALIAIVAVASGYPAELVRGIGGDGKGRGARVERVVDGDTLRVRVGSRSETVRLIGIDTPESVKPGAPVECGGVAASRALARRALADGGRGRSVTLRRDPTQDRRDRYGRLLAYVELRDGTDLGRQQVRDGWARVYVFAGEPFQRLRAYRAAARRAEVAARGVHSRCGGAL